MLVAGGRKMAFRYYGLANFTSTIPKEKKKASKLTPEEHEIHREHWERQKAARKKRDRLELMLEMKRLKEL